MSTRKYFEEAGRADTVLVMTNGNPVHPEDSEKCEQEPIHRSHHGADGSIPILPLGCIGACVYASMSITSQATPLMASHVYRHDASQTLNLLSKIGVASSAACLLVLPVAGRMADRFGRRMVLLSSLATTALSHGLAALRPSPGTLLLSQAMQSALGIGGATDVCVSAMLSDCVSGTKLATSTAAVNAMVACGMLFMPIIGGYLTRRNLRLPYAGAAVTSGAAWLCCFFALRETTTDASRAACAKTQDQEEGGLLATDKCFNPLACLELFRRSRQLAKLSLVVCLSMGAEYTYTVRTLFYRDRFGMKPDEIGWLSSRIGMVAILSSVLTKFVVKALGPSATILLGQTASAVHNVLSGLSHTKSRLYALVWLQILGGMAMRMPAINSSHTEQGKRDGLGYGEIASMRNTLLALCRLVIPLMHTRVLYEQNGGEGRPFIAAGALCIAANAVYVLG
eukprot:m.888406 g.888406  ORF g.888406 m.888406 type:complete len:453 (-) comp23638_c0_seq9:2086-3444(-)